MTLETHNWSSTAHQEIHKILKDEIFPIVNQFLKYNFEIQFLKEVAKFIRDFQSLANEADESLDKQKKMEREIDCLLRAVNDWHTKCEECKYDKILYDKAYNDMKQMIEWLQAQLGDLKGKSKDTSCASDTLDPLSQKLENENVELEFQVQNYGKEIAHLKTTYKNLFDSISVTRAQNKTLTDSLQTQLQDFIYENAKLRAKLSDKVSEQKNTNKGSSANTKFANQSILGRPFLQPIRNNFVMRQPNAFQSKRPKLSNNRTPQKVDKTNDLSKPVTSNSVPSTHEPKVVNITKVIALGMLRMNPTMNSRVDMFVPNKYVKASVRTKPTTASQPRVITKNDSEKIEENHRSLQSSHYLNSDHTSSACNNIKLAIRNEKSEVICATCKQCLITTNHDDCVLLYVNGMKSKRKNQSADVSKSANQTKHKAQVWKPKNVGSKERLASPKPRSPRHCFKWSPTGRMFDPKGKIITSSKSVCQSVCSKGCQKWFDTLLIPLLSEYSPKDKEYHRDNKSDI
ncbi:hypothetical protein Tco_0666944 [Tanacetum coccineum]